MTLQPTPPEPKSIFKNPFLYSGSILAVIALFVCLTFFSRWHDDRVIERRAAEEKSRRQREADRLALEQLGGKDLTIQNFYAYPGAIRRGQSTQLCYGVANAKTVTLEPQSGPVWPSHANCVEVTPSKSTTYILTIADAAGHTLSQSLEVKVTR